MTENYYDALFNDIIKSIVPNFNDLPIEKKQQYQHFYDIVLKMFETHIRKDMDYGSSYKKARERIGNHAYAYILEIKSGRYFSLMDSQVNRVGEKIEDTLIDLANYTVMELALRNIDELEKNINSNCEFQVQCLPSY